MKWSHWSRLFALNGRAPSSRSRNRRLSATQAEILEDRCLLATFTVMNLNDSGAGSLRQAVLDANAAPNVDAVDVIEFDAALALQTIELTTGELLITDGVTITGNTQPDATADSITISGGNLSRVFHVAQGFFDVMLGNLTITRGFVDDAQAGGGLLNESTDETRLRNVVVSASTAGLGGGLANVGQGDLATRAELIVDLSRIIGNTATGGGGVFNDNGHVVIGTSTITQNTATGSAGGGGLLNDNDGLPTDQNVGSTLIISSTIFQNVANSGPGGGLRNLSANEQFSRALSLIYSTIAQNSGVGAGGISSAVGYVELEHVTVVGNVDPTNAVDGAGGVAIEGGTFEAEATVISQNVSASNPNYVGPGIINFGRPNFISQNDPLLGPLQDNGGPTLTMLPLPGSPLIDAGGFRERLTDQRGYESEVSGFPVGTVLPRTDIGSTEFLATIFLDTDGPAYVVGSGPGQAPLVRAYNQDGFLRFEIMAYHPDFRGGVNVAIGDVNEDGTPDVITGAGPGGGPHVRVFNGVDGSVMRSFFAYDVAFLGGVNVAAADFTHDGADDVITGAGPGGGPHVRVFDGQSLQQISGPLGSFFAYDLDFHGGVTVAADSTLLSIIGQPPIPIIQDRIVTAPGPGTPQPVRVFSFTFGGGLQVDEFFAYPPDFTGGTFVTTGDVNNDGRPDIITGQGAGGGPQVLVFDGVTLDLIRSILAYHPDFRGGVRVGSLDVNGDGFDDVITGAGPGGGPHVRIFSGQNLFDDLRNDFPFDVTFPGGTFVAGAGTNRFSLLSGLRIAEDLVPQTGPVTLATTADLNALTTAVIERFAQAGLDPAAVSALQNVTVALADLPGDLLGLAGAGSILIDQDAAGFGWFVDPTPEDDIEFQTATGQATTFAALGRVDLLTVIAHELGHLLGRDDLDHETRPNHLMADRLLTGVRRMGGQEELAALHATFGGFPTEGIL